MKLKQTRDRTCTEADLSNSNFQKLNVSRTFERHFLQTISCRTMYILKGTFDQTLFNIYIRTVLYEGVTHPVNTEGALNPVKNEKQRVFYKKRENASRCLSVKNTNTNTNTNNLFPPIPSDTVMFIYDKYDNKYYNTISCSCLLQKMIKKNSILQILCVFIWKKKRGHLGIHLCAYTVKKC